MDTRSRTSSLTPSLHSPFTPEYQVGPEEKGLNGPVTVTGARRPTQEKGSVRSEPGYGSRGGQESVRVQCRLSLGIQVPMFERRGPGPRWREGRRRGTEDTHRGMFGNPQSEGGVRRVPVYSLGCVRTGGRGPSFVSASHLPPPTRPPSRFVPTTAVVGVRPNTGRDRYSQGTRDRRRQE